MSTNRFLKIIVILVVGIVCFSPFTINSQAKPYRKKTPPAAANELFDFTALNNHIRDGKIKKQDALHQLQSILPQIKRYYYAHGGKDNTVSEWVFPLSGYNAKATGGKNGSCYIAAGYNYFDGNKHGGHPAHDIFIRDKNQDCMDDKNGKPVNVLSMTHGIVVATETNWQTSSDQRGGNYIWIYMPDRNMFCYYAHNSKVLVHERDIVKPGDIIAEVGRTGLNACKMRSPTHLHFMMLQLDSNFYPKPVDAYTYLVRVSK